LLRLPAGKLIGAVQRAIRKTDAVEHRQAADQMMLLEHHAGVPAVLPQPGPDLAPRRGPRPIG